MARFFGFAFAAILLAVPLTAATAQINPSLSEAERGIGTDESGAAKHLVIDELLVRARVAGRTADVTLEMRIGSDSDANYEARLALALPANAVVTGYALSVGGAMIPGQLIEQPKARNVYQDEVRAGIDPGLAEVSAGNRFTTRIFPIDRAHPRRFRLSFVVPFDPARGIVLPLSRDTPIGKLALDVRAEGDGAPPAVQFAGNAVPLVRDGAGWRGSVEAANRPLRDGLVITAAAPAAPILVARHANGERFFVIAGSAAPSGTPARGRLRIYWDRSLSHGRDKPEIEAEILARLADQTAPGAIDLVSFASDAPRVTTLRDAADLRRALGAMVYRGGTSLAGLDGVSLPPAAQCVLVFDGQVTIDRAAEFAPDCPLSMLTASTGADGPRLDRLAQHTGAVVVRARADSAGAARELASTAPRVASVRDDAGRRLAFRALPAEAGSWLLVGRMPDRGDVRVRLSDGSERRYEAPSAAVDADAPGALWAAQEVQALGDDPARHAAMAALARRYSVAGPAMSFLVLERPDQYLRADIAPPRGFSAEWMDQYREAKRTADIEAGEARTKRLAFVVGEWQARKTWWNQRFVARRVKRAEAAPAFAPPPAPVPVMAPSAAEPVPAPPEAESGAAGDIIVTSSRIQDSLVPVSRPAVETDIKVDLANLVADSPYIAAIAAAAFGDRLRVLAEQERAYGSLPSFYLDTAEWFRIKGDTATAALLLLSALELPTSDDETRQILAFRLERDGVHDRAVELAEQLAAANAEFRPQPARDLALALAARGAARGKAGRADLERAFGLLTDAALNPATSDFDGFEVIALMEANALIPEIEALGGSWTLDDRLVALLDTDARIVIEWTADDADIDLWVDEPNGERVYYGDKLSSAGGQISNDMTDGYGPEEYAIRRAPPGAYAVRVNGYDADRLNPNGPGHVLIRLVRNFARRSEKQILVDADLSFQQGRNRDSEDRTRPIATLTVAR